METLRDEILDALQSEGYDLLTSLEYWNEFKSELKEMKTGKHKIYVGKNEITFTIK